MYGYSKEQQLARDIKRKKAKEEARKGKGATLETEVAAALGGRRNHQGRAGGGVSNPDVSALRDWNIETKNTERLEIPKWLKNLEQETPANKKPGLVFVNDGTPWLTIKLADRANFAADLIECAGGEVTFK